MIIAQLPSLGRKKGLISLTVTKIHLLGLSLELAPVEIFYLSTAGQYVFIREGVLVRLCHSRRL